jgi:excisionase family DNA binding protein
MKKRMSTERLMTVRELADFLCIHPQTVYQLIYQRKIPFIRKRGVGYRFSQREIGKWLELDHHPTEEPEGDALER